MLKSDFQHSCYESPSFIQTQQQQQPPQMPDHMKCGEVYTWLCAGELYAVECTLCEDHPLCPLSEFPEHIEIWHTNWEEINTERNFINSDKSDSEEDIQIVKIKDVNNVNSDRDLSFITENGSLLDINTELHNTTGATTSDEHLEIPEPFEQVLIEQDINIDVTIQTSEDVNEKEYFNHVNVQAAAETAQFHIENKQQEKQVSTLYNKEEKVRECELQHLTVSKQSNRKSNFNPANNFRSKQKRLYRKSQSKIKNVLKINTETHSETSDNDFNKTKKCLRKCISKRKQHNSSRTKSIKKILNKVIRNISETDEMESETSEEKKHKRFSDTKTLKRKTSMQKQNLCHKAKAQASVMESEMKANETRRKLRRYLSKTALNTNKYYLETLKKSSKQKRAFRKLLKNKIENTKERKQMLNAFKISLENCWGPKTIKTNKKETSSTDKQAKLNYSIKEGCKNEVNDEIETHYNNKTLKENVVNLEKNKIITEETDFNKSPTGLHIIEKGQNGDEKSKRNQDGTNENGETNLYLNTDDEGTLKNEINCKTIRRFRRESQRIKEKERNCTIGNLNKVLLKGTAEKQPENETPTKVNKNVEFSDEIVTLFKDNEILLTDKLKFRENIDESIEFESQLTEILKETNKSETLGYKHKTNTDKDLIDKSEILFKDNEMLLTHNKFKLSENNKTYEQEAKPNESFKERNEIGSFVYKHEGNTDKPLRNVRKNQKCIETEGKNEFETLIYKERHSSRRKPENSTANKNTSSKENTEHQKYNETNTSHKSCNKIKTIVVLENTSQMPQKEEQQNSIKSEGLATNYLTRYAKQQKLKAENRKYSEKDQLLKITNALKKSRKTELKNRLKISKYKNKFFFYHKQLTRKNFRDNRKKISHEALKYLLRARKRCKRIFFQQLKKEKVIKTGFWKNSMRECKPKAQLKKEKLINSGFVKNSMRECEPTAISFLEELHKRDSFSNAPLAAREKQRYLTANDEANCISVEEDYVKKAVRQKDMIVTEKENSYSAKRNCTSKLIREQVDNICFNKNSLAEMTEPVFPFSPTTEETNFEFYAPKEKLNRQHISHLIKLYHQQPRLWDQSHPDFCEPQLCRKSWQQITEEWNKYCERKFSIAEVRIRICTLCQRFVQEKDRLALEGELDHCTKFPYYEQMKFLEHQKSLHKRREFYEQQNEKILEIYQHFPVLWHINFYKSRQAQKRAEAFESISKVLKLFGLFLSSAGVQKRIRSLRKCYRLEKIHYLHAQVEQTPFQTEFRHYKRMQFLDKHIDPFVCCVCGKIFENLQGYREHLHVENHGSILPEDTDTDEDKLEETFLNEEGKSMNDFSFTCNQIESLQESENSTDILQRFTPFSVTSNPYIEHQLTNLENNPQFFPVNDSPLSEEEKDEKAQFIKSATICNKLTDNNNLYEEVLSNSMHTENSVVVEHPDEISSCFLSPLTNSDSLISVSLDAENSFLVEHMDTNATDQNFNILQRTDEIEANSLAAAGVILGEGLPKITTIASSVAKELENQVTAEIIEKRPPSSVGLMVKVQCADYSVNLNLNTEPLTTLLQDHPDFNPEFDSSGDNSTTPLPDHLIHKMIELYRKFPQLWDPNHLDFNSRTLRRQAWINLTFEFNSIAGKQLSWRTLHRKLIDYSKYYKKLVTEQDDYGNFANKWIFYEDFKFLDDVIAVNTELQRSVHHRDNNFKIISTYKTFPQLWNIKHCDFGKRSCKQRNFELMCNRLQEENNLQLTTERLKNRLIELRAHYRMAKKQRIKYEKNHQQFSANEFEFYEALNFLEDHIDPFNCDNCKMEFKKLTDYNQHVKKEHALKKRSILPPAEPGLENVCHICGIKFTTRSNLIPHIKRHEGIRNFHCSICPKKFYASHALKVHIRSHTKECPYTCEKCGISFVSSSKLNQHVKRHLNQKDFECSYCTKAFFTAFEKDRHERRHLNIRDKVCTICGKSFVAGSSYYAHLMLHNDTKRFECDKCDMKFAQYPGLFKHKKRHHT